MAIHKNFPQSPYKILEPDIRWLPADERFRETSYEKLLPPFVHNLRKEVKQWRDNEYKGASKTSISLLNWWFKTEHLLPQADKTLLPFQYYYAQREAVETVIYLYDTVKIKDKYDLLRYDSSGSVTAKTFDEDWRRFVIKMATGSGKTKVLSLILAWCFFHKLYEPDSELARNFLLITPNIIVLDRIRSDFDGLKIFFSDPVLPDNGYEGQNWHDDFQLTLHIQDEISIVRKTGNIFLTNIHRIYTSDDTEPSFNDDNTLDYFMLNKKPTGKTIDSKTDIGRIVRDINELVILNDEAHHIHDSKLAWFKSIEDIHNKLKQKDTFLSLQVDVTATPKHNDGSIFVQTVSDYPLVEAITQNVVKHPVLPDTASRSKLDERQSAVFTEKYADYINLGVEEWRKAYPEHKKLGKKAILFIMTDDTKNCDDVAEYLEKTYPEFHEAVLTIHTNKSGEIKENVTGKSKEELDKLRQQSNKIDSWDSPYKAIISVLMLKEGWDVRNVTTIVGLRAYSSKSNILPEQTLGRGLRRMYFGRDDIAEEVSVVGTDAFMDFVESIQSEGVELIYKPMNADTQPIAPTVVEVDNENTKKDIDQLDIEIPILSPRIYREFTDLSELDISAFNHKKIEYKIFPEEKKRAIVFKDIATGEHSHNTELKSIVISDYRNAIGFFARSIMQHLGLFSGYNILYGKVKDFIINHLFTHIINIDDLNSIKNLSEVEATKTIIESFKKQINNLTLKDKGTATINNYIKLKQTHPFISKQDAYIIPKKSVFNKIVGDSQLELNFASFLENCDDIISYTKNFSAIHFKIDYINADGSPSNYYPDFIIKVSNSEIVIVETKGLEDLDVPLKMNRLKQWCEDININQNKTHFDFCYVDEEMFNTYTPKSFNDIMKIFTKYK